MTDHIPHILQAFPISIGDGVSLVTLVASIVVVIISATGIYWRLNNKIRANTDQLNAESRMIEAQINGVWKSIGERKREVNRLSDKMDNIQLMINETNKALARIEGILSNKKE